MISSLSEQSLGADVGAHDEEGVCVHDGEEDVHDEHDGDEDGGEARPQQVLRHEGEHHVDQHAHRVEEKVLRIRCCVVMVLCDHGANMFL